MRDWLRRDGLDWLDGSIVGNGLDFVLGARFFAVVWASPLGSGSFLSSCLVAWLSGWCCAGLSAPLIFPTVLWCCGLKKTKGRRVLLSVYGSFVFVCLVLLLVG